MQASAISWIEAEPSDQVGVEEGMRWFRDISQELAVVYLTTQGADQDDSNQIPLEDPSAASSSAEVDGREIIQKLHELIDALYSEDTVCHVNTQVTFEDGRTGSLEADVKIGDAKTFTVKCAIQEAAA